MERANNDQVKKMTKNNFLTVYPAFLHRFSHMSMDLQDYIIADPKIAELYQNREQVGELDLGFDKQNDQLVEDQVNNLIDQYN
ncbi:hypothetical protein [Companilactobacillus versmoldensis]|uniref:Uncharacterized protein n=1 Tax=Companilactobacillus versmoldensis DSM 14857 = KCTC 3814 TaxID=1423815 RepID=A0A0R1SB20_9LACO|nr:hypothetical protein [Companilactobacillus versmoldensis]KRL66397.1 hypothetical protein FC27_GL000537 [Companilactobacillus versmoldensis DSM 14857 = KCTC 3814]